MEYGLGLHQSPPDYRDFIYGQMVAAEPLPRICSRRAYMGPVRDQGRFGTCGGHAGAAVKDGQEAMNYPGKGLQLSPLYVYSKAKTLDGMPGVEGTTMRAVMQVLFNYGVCRDQTMPYSLMGSPVPQPSASAEAEAGKYKVKAYARVQTLEELKLAIYKEGPCAIGIIVFENFMKPLPGGIMPLPGDCRSVGGHAMAAIGWDDDRQLVEVKNSWGSSWGDNGYVWIPYSYFTMQGIDPPINYWMESWSSVDVILPSDTTQGLDMWLYIDSPFALVNGKEVTLDQPPTITKATGRTTVPVRFIAENLGCNVAWDPKARSIHITN